MKTAWNVAPVLQIVQKISEKYWPCLYLSIDQVWCINELWFKRIIQKCTLPQGLILTVMSQIWYIIGWLKIQKPEYLQNGT